MKKVSFILASVFSAMMVSAVAAQAGEVQLQPIDTNNCPAALSEIRLLNGNGVSVIPSCEYGTFTGHNGQVYNSRLNTLVQVPYDVHPGMTIQLASIDTHNCAYAVSEIKLLSSAQVTVVPTCEAGSFAGHNGEQYEFRVNTAITLN